MAYWRRAAAIACAALAVFLALAAFGAGLLGNELAIWPRVALAALWGGLAVVAVLGARRLWPRHLRSTTLLPDEEQHGGRKLVALAPASRLGWIGLVAGIISLVLTFVFAFAFGLVDQWANGQGWGVLAAGMWAFGIAAIILGALGIRRATLAGEPSKPSRTARTLGIVGTIAPLVLGIGLQGYFLQFDGTHDAAGSCTDRDLRATILSVSARSAPGGGVTMRIDSVAPYPITAGSLRIWTIDEQFMFLIANDTILPSGATATVFFHGPGPTSTTDAGSFTTTKAWDQFSLGYDRALSQGHAATMRCSLTGDNAPEAFLR